MSATRRLVARYASATDDARSRRWSVSLLSAAALVLLVGMSVAPAVARSRSWNGPTGDWHAALSWLRTSTPDPFADPATYWKSFDGDVAKPRASYTVGSWWDFGYWILRGAHRVPVANPTQAGAETMARLLLAADDAAATRLARSAGIRYLAIEASLPMLTLGEPPRPTGKFRSIARFAAERPERYLEVVERRENGTLTLHTIFHPAYYETLLVRLLLGGGAGLEPEGPVHVVELVPAGASGRRELVRLEPYATYAAARASLAGRDPARFVLAGFDPVRTCVPLAPSALFRLAYASPTPLPAVARRPGVVEIYAMEPAGAQRGATVP